MFKEKYVRDNNLIKPDDAFLQNLKMTIEKEKLSIQAEMNVGLTDDVKKENIRRFSTEKTAKYQWKKVVLAAACFALVFTLGVMVNYLGLYDNRHLKSDIKSAVKEYVDVDTSEATKQYEQLCELFQQNTVVLYQVNADWNALSDADRLPKAQEQGVQLTGEQRDALIQAFVEDEYTVDDCLDDFTETTYYYGVFDDDTTVFFAVCKDRVCIIEFNRYIDMVCN